MQTPGKMIIMMNRNWRSLESRYAYLATFQFYNGHFNMLSSASHACIC